MHQQIRNDEYRIIVFFTDMHFHLRAVFFYDDTMQGQRQRDPLILLDAAVIMGVQIRKLTVFIQRILLQIQTRGIDMGAQNMHSFLDRTIADMKQHDRFIHHGQINLILRA